MYNQKLMHTLSPQRVIAESLETPGEGADINYLQEHREKNPGRRNSSRSHINMLVNCAGGALKAAVPQDQYSEDSKEEGNFFTTASEKIHQEFDLNIYGTILPTQIFGEVLIGQENANIINVSSMGAYHPMTRIPGYAGAKAAVTNFTEWAATYFAKSGVRVNAVAPGFFQTPQNHDLQFFPDGTPTPRTKKIIAATPMGRFGKPEELAGAVLFLADPSSSFVTGTVIPVDGGFHCYLGV